MIPLKREIDQIAKDKGIDKKIIVDALKEAMVQAAHKKYGADKAIEPTYNEETGEVELFEFRTVVEVITDPDTQVLIAKARELDPEVEGGDEIGVKLHSQDFGRILAQVAKQVIIQRVREAERGIVFDEYKDRKGEVVNGIVRRFEKGSLIVDLGRAEAVLPGKEQVARESYRPGDRIRAYVIDVNREAKGPQIILSRASIELLNKLFESEVPEIYEGIVTIESAAREPGVRSKIAVASRDNDVDPVGACVGMKGSRVQAVVQELRGEKIDIVPWDEDPARFVCNALQPAEVSRVLLDEQNKAMEIIVPDDQLSLAIGRRGQNVRLAAQLTGWKLDINSESRVKEMREFASKSLTAIGLPEATVELLYAHGFRSAKDFANASTEVLLQMPGITGENVEKYLGAARDQIGKDEEELSRIEREREEARAAEARRHPSELTQAERLLRVRGISERNIEQMANAGYKTVEDIHNEPDVVKFGEATGLGVKKGKQVKAAVEHYLQEEARLKADLDAKKAAATAQAQA